MIIRFRGASHGVVTYLRDGKKSGRYYSRDELDQRVQLCGNLTELDTVLNSFDRECKTQKYFHISLSFKEKNISEEVLKNIDDEFRKFIFSSCVEGEFYYFSEIHFPKIQSLIDMQGKNFKRYPHIHVVIPEYNLYTGKRDNPLGLVDKRERYINAFQEYINEKYELESPKENRRMIKAGREEVIARYEIKPDMTNKEIKQTIFSIIQNNPQISSVTELAQVIKGFGTVTVRDSKSFGQPYINLKIVGKDKGINLKDPVFLNHYLENRTANVEFVHDNQHLLDEWYEYAACEARFVEKAAKHERDAYVAMNLPEKKSWLAAQWHHHLKHIGYEDSPQSTHNFNYETITVTYVDIDHIPHIDDVPYIGDCRHLDEIPNLDEAPHINEIYGDLNDTTQIEQRNSRFSMHELRTRRGNGNRGQRKPLSMPNLLQNDQCLDMVRNEKITFEELYTSSHERNVAAKRFIDQQNQQREVLKHHWSELINSIDSRNFLNYISYHYGLEVDNYRIEKNKSGNERIIADDRKYSVSDFLTKKMHMTWTEAQSILRTVAAQQQIGEQRKAAVTSRLMWQRFMRYEANKKNFSTVKSEYFTQRRMIKARYQYVHNDEISRGENAAKYRLIKMQKAAELAKLEQEYEEQARYYRQKMHDRYMEYLYEEAEQGNSAALGELNRIYPIRDYAQRDVFEICIKEQKHHKQQFSLIDLDYKVKIKRNGTIEYQDEREKTVIIDSYNSIKVTDRSVDIIVKALELAKLRYGRDGFEIRNATEQDLVAIQAAVNKTGVEVRIMNKEKNQDRGR